MEVLPDDTPAREDRVKRWAVEQRTAQSRSRWARLKGLRLRLAIARARRRQATQRSFRFLNRSLARVFDRGLDTTAEAHEPEHAHPDRLHYAASSWHVLPRALRYLGVSDSDTFVEFGCGKGRVVHQAAKRPFRRVIGVEISPILAEIARKNVAAGAGRHRCRDVEIVVSDVQDFQVPDDLTIGYLYHPFTGETFETLLRNIVDSIDRHPRRVRLIYVLPVHREQVLATGRFRAVKSQRNRLLDAPAGFTEIYESV